MQITVSEIVLS